MLKLFFKLEKYTKNIPSIQHGNLGSEDVDEDHLFYLLFQDKFYQETSDTPMRSPLTSYVTDIFMEALEAVGYGVF